MNKPIQLKSLVYSLRHLPRWITTGISACQMPEVGFPISAPPINTLWELLSTEEPWEQPPPHPLVANRPEEPIVAGGQVPLLALRGPCARLGRCHCACQSWNRNPGCMTPGRMPSLPALCCLSFLIVFIGCVFPPHTPLLRIEVNANNILRHLLTFSKWTKYHCYCSMSLFCLLRSVALFPRSVLFSV